MNKEPILALLFLSSIRNEVIKITVEELDIIVYASIEQALKEFKKLYPEIKGQIDKITDTFNKSEFKAQIANFDIKNLQNEALKARKKVQEIFDPEDTSGMKIHLSTENISNTIDDKNIEVPKYKNTKLDEMYQAWGRGEIDFAEIKKYKAELEGVKNTSVTPKVDTSIWESIKEKIHQVKVYFEEFKSNINQPEGSKQLDLIRYKISEIEEKLENAKQGKIHLNTEEIIKAEAELERLQEKKNKLENSGQGGNAFSGIFSSVKSAIPKVIPSMEKVNGISIKIKNSFSQMGSGIKSGFGHILKYAGALLSLRGIYSILSGSARSWLSSQNEGAQQLSANIDYLKYAMGSVLAPIIQYVTNLVYQLMKALQSVVYAFSGINIFAKATASSMKKASGGAKSASKSLASVHSEISNVSDNKSGGSGGNTPDMDLSKMSDTSNSILDAIKNGNWYEVGSLIGEKINESMEKIPWDKIQNTARKIGKGIAEFLNGFIATTNWNKVGYTFAQGLNTAIYFGYEFITNFNWKQFGTAIGRFVNGTFDNIDFATAGKGFGEGIKGIFNSISSFIEEVDWAKIVKDAETFILNVDWTGIARSIFQAIGAGFGACASLIGQALYDVLYQIGKYFQYWVDYSRSIGGNIVDGLLAGILYGIGAIATWIYNNIFLPFINGFKNAFKIHSPSQVMYELGVFIIQGVLNGISSLVEKILEIWNNLRNKVVEIVTNTKDKVNNKVQEMKDSVVTKFNDLKTKALEKITNLKNTTINTFDTLKSSIFNKISNIKNTIVNGFESAVNYIRSLPRTSI